MIWAMILRRLSDDRRAMYVDYYEPRIIQGELTVVMVRNKVEDGRKEPMGTPDNYKLCVLKDPDDWIVLTWGGDEMLMP